MAEFWFGVCGGVMPEEIDATVLLARMKTMLKLAKLLEGTRVRRDDAEPTDAADGVGAPPLI